MIIWREWREYRWHYAPWAIWCKRVWLCVRLIGGDDELWIGPLLAWEVACIVWDRDDRAGAKGKANAH